MKLMRAENVGVFWLGEGGHECSGQSCEDGNFANFQSSSKLFNMIGIKATAKLVRVLSLSIENIH